jgi:hypothetical protein
MDEEIRGLERQLEGQPQNRSMLSQLARLYNRAGRLFLGKTIDQWQDELFNKNWRQVLLAATALKSAGKIALLTSPAIVQILEKRLLSLEGGHHPENDNSGIFVEIALIETLQVVDGYSVGGLNTLIRMVENEDLPDDEVRIAAANALGAWEQRGKAAIPSLLEAVDSYDWELSVAAMNVLGKIGPQSPEVILALVEALDHDDQDVFRAAAEALGQFAREDRQALQALLGFLDGNDDWTAQCVLIEVIGKLGPQSKDAVSALIVQLQDEDADVQIAAANALMQIGPLAKAALPALSERLAEEDAETWRIMAEAILNIQSTCS